MPTTRSKRMALTQLLVGACVLVFGTGVLIVPGQAQFVPPPAPPPPAPVLNPPSPDRTVPQPSYTPLSPSTPSTAQSGRGVPVAKRSVHQQRHHHHHHRLRFAGYTLGSRYCGASPCVRIRPSASYWGPASGLWWPGYYDYAPGQFGRGRPRHSGYWRPTGYHGD